MQTKQEQTVNPFKCGAHRHMTASEYLTYDGMMSMSRSKKAQERMKSGKQDERLFYGKLTTLANRNNRDVEIETRNVKSLLRKGWLFKERSQVHWHGGQWSSNRYIIFTHDEYIDAGTHGKKDPLRKCPALKYDPVTGKEMKTAESKAKNLALLWANVRRRAMKGIPDDFFDEDPPPRKNT